MSTVSLTVSKAGSPIALLLFFFFLVLTECGAEQLTYLSPHTNLQNSLLSF